MRISQGECFYFCSIIFYAKYINVKCSRINHGNMIAMTIGLICDIYMGFVNIYNVPLEIKSHTEPAFYHHKKYFWKIGKNVWRNRKNRLILQPIIIILSQNKQIVARKNERNDEENNPMSSGSMTKLILSLWIDGKIVSCRLLLRSLTYCYKMWRVLW